MPLHFVDWLYYGCPSQALDMKMEEETGARKEAAEVLRAREERAARG